MKTSGLLALMAGTLALGAVAATPAQSAPVIYHITFDASNFTVLAAPGPAPFDPVSGSFTVEFDPAVSVSGGAAISYDLGDINVTDSVLYNYSPDLVGGVLDLYGLLGGVGISVGADDFQFSIANFINAPELHDFVYSQVGLGLFRAQTRSVEVTQIPLPATLPLYAAALAGGGLIAWRRRRRAAA